MARDPQSEPVAGGWLLMPRWYVRPIVSIMLPICLLPLCLVWIVIGWCSMRSLARVLVKTGSNLAIYKW